MPTMTATEARAALYTLIDEVATTHEPVLITGKRNNSVPMTAIAARMSDKEIAAVTDYIAGLH